MAFILGAIAGFAVTVFWLAYDFSKCLKTGELLGGRYQIIDQRGECGKEAR